MKVTSLSRLTAAVVFSAALCMSTTPRAVALEGVFLAGASGSTDDSLYGYVGAVFPLFSSISDDGFLLRLWGEGQMFDYNTVLPGAPTATTETEIDVDGFGVEVAIGYQWIRPDYRVSAYVGPKYRDLETDPNDPTADLDNEDFGLKGQLELDSKLSDRWQLEAIGSYVLNIDSYWVRLRPGYRLDNGLVIGPEGVVLGGDKWDKQQLGLFLNGFQVGSGSVGIKGGLQNDSRENEVDGYVGLSYSLGF